MMNSLWPPNPPDYKAIAHLIKQYQQLAYELRGKLINSSIDLERSIEQFIANYFCRDVTKQDELLLLVIGRKLSFYRKIEILAALIVPTKYPDILRDHPNIIKDIQGVREMRNYLAHTALSVGLGKAWGQYTGHLSFTNSHKELDKEETKTVKDIEDIIKLSEDYTGFFFDYNERSSPS